MRGDERREQLIRVAISLFARKGFNGTTTKEIAAAAGVTEALIFRHFPNKDALYEAILTYKVEETSTHRVMEVLIDCVHRRDDEGLVRAVMASILAFHREDRDFQRLMLYSGLEGHDLAQRLRERLIKPVHELLVEYVQLRQREGAFLGVDPSATVRAIVSMPLHHALVSNLFACPMVQLSDEEVVEQFTRIVLEGLRSR